MNCFLKRQSANEKAKIAGNTIASVPGLTLVDHCHKRNSLSNRGKLIHLVGNMEVSHPNSMRNNNMGVYDSIYHKRESESTIKFSQWIPNSCNSF